MQGRRSVCEFKSGEGNILLLCSDLSSDCVGKFLIKKLNTER